VINDYLDELERRLAAPRRRRRRILREARAHLVEAAARERAAGATPAEAERIAIARFGSARAIAERFAEEREAVRRPRRALIAAATIGVAGAASLVATAALHQSEPGQTTVASFSWPERLPGEPFAGDSRFTRFYRGIDSDRLRMVVTAGVGEQRAGVLAAPGAADDRVYIAHVGLAGERIAVSGEFHPVNPVFEVRGGRPDTLLGWNGLLRSLPRDYALVAFNSGGGPRPDLVGWSTVVGLARDDVERVVVRHAGGEESELRLNEWRGFGYSTTRADRFPVAVKAFGDGGRLLQEITYARPAPLCGGSAGPCDDELQAIIDRKKREQR
jgi:hypothetical protein